MIDTIAKGTCDEHFESMAVQLDRGRRSVVLRRRRAGARLLWDGDADDRAACDSHARPDPRASGRDNGSADPSSGADVAADTSANVDLLSRHRRLDRGNPSAHSDHDGRTSLYGSQAGL